MKTIQVALKNRLADKKMTQVSIGALAVEYAKQFSTQPTQLTGYIRAQKLFLRGWKKENPTERFVKKKEILEKINKKLKEGGYEYILTDVRLVK